MILSRRDILASTAPLLASSIGLSGAANAQQLATNTDTATAAEIIDLRRAADALMQRHRVPGMAIAISRHGGIVFNEAFGIADSSSGERVTPAHRFRIASVSKPITSVAVFGLVERGILKLDEHVFGPRGHLRHLLPAGPIGRWLDEITIEHLLTHTAGGWPNDGNDPMFQNVALSHAELIGWVLRSQSLINRPGSAYAYSNFGYCLLGRVIEKATGKAYEDFVRGAVLQQAGAGDMRIGHNKASETHRREVHYTAESRGNPYGMNVRRMDAHGGWIGTADELVRFAHHVDGFSPGQLLKPETISSMTGASSANAGYAKGWAVNQAGNWWHLGSLPGTTSLLVRTNSRMCWAAVLNTGGPGSTIGADLDKTIWTMVRQVRRWQA